MWKKNIFLMSCNNLDFKIGSVTRQTWRRRAPCSCCDQVSKHHHACVRFVAKKKKIHEKLSLGSVVKGSLRSKACRLNHFVEHCNYICDRSISLEGDNAYWCWKLYLFTLLDLFMFKFEYGVENLLRQYTVLSILSRWRYISSPTARCVVVQ